MLTTLCSFTGQTSKGNQINLSNGAVLENPQTDVYQNLCCHKKHLRLESLKTLILADNALTKIQLSTDDITTFSETEETEWTNIGVTKLRLLYPNLSMLDISNNCLKVQWPTAQTGSDCFVPHIHPNFISIYRKCRNFYTSLPIWVF